MIRLTFVSNFVRGEPVEFDTDHAGEALAEAMRKWYGSGNHPEEAAIVSVVIERDGHRLERERVAQILADTAAMERVRAHGAEERAA